MRWKLINMLSTRLCATAQHLQGCGAEAPFQAISDSVQQQMEHTHGMTG